MANIRALIDFVFEPQNPPTTTHSLAPCDSGTQNRRRGNSVTQTFHQEGVRAYGESMANIVRSVVVVEQRGGPVDAADRHETPAQRRVPHDGGLSVQCGEP